MLHLQLYSLLALLILVYGDNPDSSINSNYDLIELSSVDLSALASDSYDTISNSSHHERRWAGGIVPPPATDEVWKRAKCKGRKFVVQMSYSDFDVGQMLPTPQNTAQSPWTFDHLPQWGYTLSGVNMDYRNLDTGGYWGIADFLRHLSISDKCREEGGLWTAATITHYRPGVPGPNNPPTQMQTYVGPDGQSRRMTGAYFYLAVNPQGGILVQNILGPSAASQNTHPNSFPDDELPHMRALSDMMWAMYSYYVPETEWAKLNFIMSLGINNPTSLGIIRRALDTVGQELSGAPLKFEPESEGGLALLGSPNGARVAHLLTQRKKEVGLKSITGVYVFECQSKSRAPCLFFKIEPLAAPVPRPQPEQTQNSEQDLDKPVDGGRMVKRLMKDGVVREYVFQFGRNETVVV
ncbi:hypothetical protein FB567DRAFT_602176 [Paraphoma chrysanthemicola]|uniref:Uncharacterized protein n=1 Tax=Paraphoma chrysanthemicola TaxID=798071 RepID=A0A8K0RMH4_9PLEO|nr:hypothetical protein FB567DRAFT_602176 [Paraphoma chrysanthemicola]